MKIVIAKTAGFCMGVRRAIETVLDAPRKYNNPIHTYGPLIHNPQILSLLEEKGIFSINHIPEKGTGTVLIRAHGVPPQIKKNLKKAGFGVVDVTCPRVIKVQAIIKKYTTQGAKAIIVGDRDHPEVVGLLGYADEKGYVVETLEELASLPPFRKAIIVAQTTQNTILFDKIKKWSEKNFPEYKIFNTICDSTESRQAEVKRLVTEVDAFVVVGGYKSGNTKRLVEIVKEARIPAYHIETESDLNGKEVISAQRIGITAGASTPNWITKRVYRKIETLPFQNKKDWRSLLINFQQKLLLTSIYVSLGAGCLSYACTKLLGISQNLFHVIISMLYVLSMHIFNNLTGIKADKYNDPEKASFYMNNKRSLAILGIIGGIAGLMTAFKLGILPFIALLIMSILGLSYKLRLVPRDFSRTKFKKLKDIPGSKTILIAVAWGVVTTLLPSLSNAESLNLKTGLVFFWSTCLVFVRTAFFDILDMQGDRIVGKETIPLIIGEKKTMLLLKTTLVGVFTIFTFASMINIISSLGLALAVCPVFLFSILSIHERGFILSSTRLEFLVESQFVLSGIITFIWVIFYG